MNKYEARAWLCGVCYLILLTYRHPIDYAAVLPEVMQSLFSLSAGWWTGRAFAAVRGSA
jgi:hypothetical protein